MNVKRSRQIPESDLLGFLSGFGQSTTKNPPDTTKNMFVKADTTLVVTQELRISKFESQKEKDKKKREK